MISLKWRLTNCLAGDPHELLTVSAEGDHGDDRVDCLFSKMLPFQAWRLRRALRFLRAEWVKKNVGPLSIPAPDTVVS